jgi:two-component system, HptB-dependent secretion and biofilm response regulator
MTDAADPIRILLAEDNASVLALLDKFLQKIGHVVEFAENGQKALDKYLLNPPDLLLTDINMPVMNGLELIEKVRANQTETWVPIIILSALGDEEDIIKGLETGADDYLSKPINLSILRAKIKSMQKMISLQSINKHTKEELRKANDDLEQEQKLAKNLADNILSQGNIEHPCVEYWLCAAKQFSGDIIAASQTADGRLYIMVADSSGHGLSAALPTLAVAKIFHTMSNKGFSIPSIVAEMNLATKSMLPEDRFVATALFSIDFHQKVIECWNGGLPAALVVNKFGKIVHEFKSDNLAISILSTDQFNSRTTLYHWDDTCELIVYTDGLIEAENLSGEQFGLPALLSVIKDNSQGKRLQAIKEQAINHLGSGQGEDDISLLAINCEQEIES